MKKILIVVLVIIVIILGIVFALRAPSAPSQSASDAAGQEQTTASSTVYKIVPAQSLVTFSINEILRNKPKTAIGTTSEIGGEISVIPSGLTIGTIAVNARTFKTDSAGRDGAIARFILKSEDAANEFMYFKPTSVQMSSSTTATSTLTSTATVTGDLTISGVTKPANFLVSWMASGNTITGTATTTLKRSDFNLNIPNVPFVANVDDQFTVVSKITAEKVQ
ncbi:MAG: YceI family protein [Patescibacteria group bacterium]